MNLQIYKETITNLIPKLNTLKNVQVNGEILNKYIKNPTCKIKFGKLDEKIDTKNNEVKRQSENITL